MDHPSTYLFYICFTTLTEGILLVLWAKKHEDKTKSLLLISVLFASFSAVLQLICTAYTVNVIVYIIKYMIHYIFLVKIFRLNKERALYYLVIFLLITDCWHKIFRYISMRYLGNDFLITGQLWKVLLSNIGLLLIISASLWLIRPLVVQKENIGEKTTPLRQIWVIIIVIFPYLYVRNIHYFLPLNDSDINPGIPILLTVSCICALIVIIGNEKLINYYIKQKDMVKLESIIKSQQARFEAKKEIAETINHKYHDIKHYLSALEGMSDINEIRTYIQLIKQEITPYEKLLETGNAALDVLYSEKIALCQNNHIRCNAIVDGHCLEFMSPLDVCTIFGNAFDNAIEALRHVSEQELKQIWIKAFNKDGFAIIQFQNYFTRPPRFLNGQIITGKENKTEHGFGILNMKSIAEKYNGEITIKTQEQKFILTIIIPYPEY